MNKYIRKSLYIGLSALMIAGLGASMSGNAHASINPNRYGIDVFPSKKTHNRFAYQLRRRGHNSRVYYANRNSKLGKAIFDHSVPNIDYADYMIGHHFHWYNSITNRLEGHVAKRRVQAKRHVRKVVRKRRRAIKRNKRNKRVKRYNRKARMNHKRVRRHGKNAGIRVVKSHFKRSNNKRLLKRSGYFDARDIGGDFIFNKYAPNDKRAVVPKNFRNFKWYKGHFGLKNPTGYMYDQKIHGWVEFK